MTTTIRSEHLNETIEEHITLKTDKLHHYLPNIDSIEVELDKQHSHRGPALVIAQITVRHSRGAILRAEERVDYVDYNTFKVAINGATDKMYRRIRRFKGKKRSKRMRAAYIASQEELLQAEELPVEAETVTVDIEGNEEEVEILRRKDVQLQPMNEAEAIEQMELLGHGFFMFFNMDTESINLIYRRANGGYGLLNPNSA